VVMARIGKDVAVLDFLVDTASGSNRCACMSDRGDAANPTSKPSEKLRVDSVARAMPSSRREMHGISVSVCALTGAFARRKAAVRYGKMFVARAT